MGSAACWRSGRSVLDGGAGVQRVARRRSIQGGDAKPCRPPNANSRRLLLCSPKRGIRIDSRARSLLGWLHQCAEGVCFSGREFESRSTGKPVKFRREPVAVTGDCHDNRPLILIGLGRRCGGMIQKPEDRPLHYRDGATTLLRGPRRLAEWQGHPAPANSWQSIDSQSE